MTDYTFSPALLASMSSLEDDYDTTYTSENTGITVTVVGDGLDYAYYVSVGGEVIAEGAMGFSEGYYFSAEEIAEQDVDILPPHLLFVTF
jgi:hypothetical protein